MAKARITPVPIRAGDAQSREEAMRRSAEATAPWRDVTLQSSTEQNLSINTTPSYDTTRTPLTETTGQSSLPVAPTRDGRATRISVPPLVVGADQERLYRESLLGKSPGPITVPTSKETIINRPGTSVPLTPEEKLALIPKPAPAPGPAPAPPPSPAPTTQPISILPIPVPVPVSSPTAPRRSTPAPTQSRTQPTYSGPTTNPIDAQPVPQPAPAPTRIAQPAPAPAPVRAPAHDPRFPRPRAPAPAPAPAPALVGPPDPNAPAPAPARPGGIRRGVNPDVAPPMGPDNLPRQPDPLLDLPAVPIEREDPAAPIQPRWGDPANLPTIGPDGQVIPPGFELNPDGDVVPRAPAPGPLTPQENPMFPVLDATQPAPLPGRNIADHGGAQMPDADQNIAEAELGNLIDSTRELLAGRDSTAPPPEGYRWVTIRGRHVLVEIR